MNSITATYPDFQLLPKGIRKMLVISESEFFEAARASQKSINLPAAGIYAANRAGLGSKLRPSTGYQIAAH